MTSTEPKSVSGGVLAARGFVGAGVACGIKGGDTLDLVLIHCPQPCAAAATVTTNRMRSVTCDITEQNLADGTARTVVANSGNANACTGAEGARNARRMAELAAEVTGVAPEEVVVCSTGAIGVQLPMEKIEAGIREAGERLAPDRPDEVARAIMTTDTVPKQSAYEVETGGRTVRVGGICKGAGMIEPRMATMLCFISTDAVIEAPLLRETLRDCVDLSFNRISVDGSRSTNDTVAILANGQAGNAPIQVGAPEAEAFRAALLQVTTDLAQMIVRDGEGTSKFIEIKVTGARDEAEAEQLARAVANYALVKTAVFGGDFNWGRIAAAVGAAGVDFERDEIEISLAGIKVWADGEPQPFDGYAAEAAMQEQDVSVEMAFCRGDGAATMWAADLTLDYVKFNADREHKPGAQTT
jgi:glutamate N-acetyltransferase/amino-acid N-acetyltransferase